MEIITSRNNRRIVEYGKLKNKKYRDETGLFYFEGVKLLQEAVKMKIPLEAVLFHESCVHLESELPDGIPRYAVSGAVYEKLTDENAPQGVFCVAKHLDNLHKSATIYGRNYISRNDVSRNVISPTKNLFLMEGVRDPGNLGTILRTACALNVDTLILSSDCADLYNPKTVRAAMGAVFRQKTVRVDDCPSSVTALREAGVSVYAALLAPGSKDVREIDCKSRPVCFAVGNEGHGLSPELIDACDGGVIIPMNPGCESLNVAAASTILLWELTKFKES